MASAEEVALAIHEKQLELGRLVELAPVVLEAADGGDVPAIELRERLADEILAFVRAAAERALTGVEHYDVVLGGSLLTGSASLGELVIAAAFGPSTRRPTPGSPTCRPLWARPSQPWICWGPARRRSGACVTPSPSGWPRLPSTTPRRERGDERDPLR